MHCTHHAHVLTRRQPTCTAPIMHTSSPGDSPHALHPSCTRPHPETAHMHCTHHAHVLTRRQPTCTAPIMHTSSPGDSPHALHPSCTRPHPETAHMHCTHHAHVLTRRQPTCTAPIKHTSSPGDSPHALHPSCTRPHPGTLDNVTSTSTHQIKLSNPCNIHLLTKEQPTCIRHNTITMQRSGVGNTVIKMFTQHPA